MSTDRIGAAIWVLLGVVTLILSLGMDRLERLGINPLTAPGLVPGLLGIALIVFGGILAFRRAPHVTGSVDADDAPGDDDGASIWPVAAVAGLCVLYAVGGLGHGLPFWLTTGVFVFCLSLLIEHLLGDASWGKRILVAGACAVFTTAFVIYVFQELMLLRLP
jgi:hypothetical protein